MSRPAIHNRVSINSICLMESATLPQQAEHWQTLNAKRISLVGPQIDIEGFDAAQAALDTGDYQLETVVHPLLPGAALNPDPSSWSKTRDALSARIDMTKGWGGKSIYMTTGGHGDMLWEQAADVFTEVIEPCVKESKNAGIALMIENAPPQYADLHIAHTLRDTVALAKHAGIGVCIDLFGCWTEPSLKQSITEAVAISNLVQVSDYVLGDRALPARAVPGDGVIPLQTMLEWILDAGYTGAFDLELLGPRITEEGSVQATARAAKVTGEILTKLGV